MSDQCEMTIVDKGVRGNVIDLVQTAIELCADVVIGPTSGSS